MCIRDSVGVVAELLGLVVAQAQVLVLHAQVQQPLVAELLPVVEPLQLGAEMCIRDRYLSQEPGGRKRHLSDGLSQAAGEATGL